MKTMRKVLSVLLVLAMILSLGAMAVSAAGNGTITVQKAVEGHTYRLYKVFDLTYSEVTTPEGTEKHAAYTYTSKGTEDVSDQFLTNMKADTSTTTTYTYGFTLRKIEKVNDVKKDLAGAKFKLYREVTVDDQKVNQEVKLCEDNGFYRPVVTTKPVGSPADAPVDAIDAGTAVIKGLALGTYYLEETEAPAGYNKLTEMVKLELKPGATDGEVDVMVAGPDGQPVAAENDTVEVLNQTGTPLPSTGGMGTTMFYVLGAVLVLGAAIALVAKRRVREQ